VRSQAEVLLELACVALVDEPGKVIGGDDAELANFGEQLALFRPDLEV
jgi:hypothetical protein